MAMHAPVIVINVFVELPNDISLIHCEVFVVVLGIIVLIKGQYVK